MRPSTIRRVAKVPTKDFFGINDITSKDIAGAFSSGTKLSKDNIEKKYNPLMGSRVRMVNEEKDTDILFGRVRRDSDNLTLKHGQYEPDKTERLYNTIELKQMFVSDDVPDRNCGVSANLGDEIDVSSIPNIQPAYKISEVEPIAEIGEILGLFKREGDEKAVAFKYKNKPPLTFCFESASQAESEETIQTQAHTHSPTLSQRSQQIAMLKSEAHGQHESKNEADKPNIRRPQVDIDARAGPEGAKAPMHELDELSLEYAERLGELQNNQVRFDRSLDRKFDVVDDEPTRPIKALEHIEKVRNKEVEPVAPKLKETMETKDRPFPLRPSIKLDSKGFRNYAHQVPDWNKIRRTDVIGHLKGSILYNNYEILAINKPYGIASHANGKTKRDEYDMDTLVAELAKSMRIEKVFLAHRLDKTTSGLLLFATSQDRARYLNKLFKADDIKKTYICITRGVPDPDHGLIDMPLGEIEVAGKLRSCPAPYDLDEKKQLSKKYREARRAITEYQVIDSKRHIALVELKPQTGVKHQLRCHMSFGLNTPVLGDHKYSHLHKLAPQTLAPSILKAFHLRQAKVRTLPMHLHAKSIVIPGAKANGETLFIDAPLPQHFIDNMRALKLSMRP